MSLRRRVNAALLVVGAATATAAAVSAPAATATGTPYVSSVSPSSGWSVGGARVDVHGHGFAAGSHVWFGSHLGTSVKVVSSTLIQVTTPAHGADVTNVRVGGSTATSSTHPGDHFTFHRTYVVLDPGHNGGNASHLSTINRLVDAGYGRRKACNTTGTATNSGDPEHAFNWDVAQRLATLLRRQAVTIILTHPTDTGVGPCVNTRAAIESRAGVRAAVAIHADGAASSGHGFHVNEDSRRPVGASTATADASLRLGHLLQAALARSSGLTPSTYIGSHGWVRRDDLAGLNLSTKPTSFLELGNMRNSGDAALQRSVTGRQRIAAAIASGLLAYLRS